MYIIQSIPVLTSHLRSVIDFFNEISLLWNVIIASRTDRFAPSEGYPPGFEYRWKEGDSLLGKSVPCGSDEYIERVLQWAQEILMQNKYFTDGGMSLCSLMVFLIFFYSFSFIPLPFPLYFPY